jgi:hypothetical protein
MNPIDGKEENATTLPPVTQGATMIQATDVDGLVYPLWIQSNTQGLTWGAAIGQTQGKMLRFHNLASPPTGKGFYDMGIAAGGDFYITGQGISDPILKITAPFNPDLPLGTIVILGQVSVMDKVDIFAEVNIVGNLTVSGGTFVIFSDLPTAPPGSRQLMLDVQGNLCVASSE